jgi:threonine synthase
LVEYATGEGLFPVGHPYRHSAIGSMADLDAASLADVRQWFRDHYGPNNAVLVLAGDVDMATARLGAPDREVAFSVPTGNFGDVFAGHVAARMGLPVARLIVATNVNDILHRALAEGDYSQGQVVPTATPSMDIQVSSNFERLLFDVGGRDGLALSEQMRGFETTKAMRLTNAQREGASKLFTSHRVDADGMNLALRWAYEAACQVIDPHSAIGLAAALAADDLPADVPVVTLATAHAAKFRDAVERATGVRPSMPARVGTLFDREEAYTRLPATYEAVTAHIAGLATARQ